MALADVDLDKTEPGTVSARDHARAMAAYLRDGEARALALPNRGPIRFGPDGRIHPDILDAYWEFGFYVFTGVVGPEELAELRADVDGMLAKAPPAPDSGLGAVGWPAAGQDFARPPYRFAKPLSDPLGGTAKNKGRHPVKMAEAAPADDAPEWTVELLHGNLHLMDSCLRLYGHPGLLAMAEAVNGPDFVPYNEVTFIKEPGLGPSVAWHRDGTTHWDAADWDQGAHGFNFMVQLFPSTPANCVWTLPGSHKHRDDRYQTTGRGGGIGTDRGRGAACLRGRRCVHPEPAGGARFLRQLLAGPPRHLECRFLPAPASGERLDVDAGWDVGDLRRGTHRRARADHPDRHRRAAAALSR